MASKSKKRKQPAPPTVKAAATAPKASSKVAILSCNGIWQPNSLRDIQIVYVHCTPLAYRALNQLENAPRVRFLGLVKRTEPSKPTEHPESTPVTGDDEKLNGMVPAPPVYTLNTIGWRGSCTILAVKTHGPIQSEPIRHLVFDKEKKRTAFTDEYHKEFIVLLVSWMEQLPALGYLHLYHYPVATACNSIAAVAFVYAREIWIASKGMIRVRYYENTKMNKFSKSSPTRGAFNTPRGVFNALTFRVEVRPIWDDFMFVMKEGRVCQMIVPILRVVHEYL